jgi:KaiC/GvpD/RAD55 family RecA-like ATPase
MLSLVESEEQICRIADIYGFDFNPRQKQPGLRLVVGRFAPDDEPDLLRIFDAAGQKPRKGDVLLVDGLGVLRAIRSRQTHVLSLIDQIKDLQLTTIFVTEEHRKGSDRFLEHAVDGIFRLGVDPEGATRTLEVLKWRWSDCYLGRHSFRLMGKEQYPDQAGIKFYPSLACLMAERPSPAREGVSTSPAGVSSGVPGFDGLVTNPKGPFRPGDCILLLGPPGAGKSLFGAQFLAAGRIAKDKKEAAVYLSFVRGYDEVAKRLSNYATDEAQPPCHFMYRSPTNLVVDECMSALHELLNRILSADGKPPLIRLFIEGIASLRCRFQSEEDFERFLLAFLRFLDSYPNLVTLVSFQVPRIFASYAEVQIPVSDHFSTIIGLNFQEIHNRLERGLVVLKCQDRKHAEDLKVALIDDKTGSFSVDPLAGWARVNLLGGQRESVREERPFVKLFYENPSDEEVIKHPFKDFADRYPGDHVFKMVAKPNPTPTHWSFLGYAGAGHSNTKIVALRKYVMDVLRDNGVLVPLPSEPHENLQARIKSAPIWADTTAPKGAAPVLLPYYADVGVFVYQQDLASSLYSHRDPNQKAVWPFPCPSTWDELLSLYPLMQSMRKEVSQPDLNLFVIPSTVTDMKGFVAFFFELCWANGWELPEPGVDTANALSDWAKGVAFSQSLDLLRRLVQDSHGAIPNPTVGGHYHKSVYSRRWFSRIHLRETDANNRARAGLPPFAFGIAPLPGVKRGTIGVSCLDLYALGLIRGALAPETAWIFASELLAPGVDADRAMRKRGIPVQTELFNSRGIQDNFKAPVPAPPSQLAAYDSLGSLFETYPGVLSRIVSGASGDSPSFRRTCDIPKFFELELLLGATLPHFFDEHDRWTEKRVVGEIVKGVNKLYGEEK